MDKNEKFRRKLEQLEQEESCHNQYNETTNNTTVSSIVVECPYCKSKNPQKISSIGKGISILTLGLLSSKIGKQWHCNNCGSDF